MNIIGIVLAVVVAILAVLFGVTRIGVYVLERRNPPVGTFVEVAGARLHVVHVPTPAGADLPPIVFIHGASANLKDQMLPLRPLLEGRAEMLFFDRPGHGWSQRGAGNDTPAGQADTISALMEREGIARAIIVGHSFGGGIAAAFALAHPDKIAGLVFLSAATHPWPDNTTSWYYKLAIRPVVGRLFSNLLTLPGGLASMAGATTCVFAPNRVPEDYNRRAAIEMVLRPGNFRSNAIDVEGLHDHVTKAAPLYPTIQAPTVVVSGDSDTVVYEEIHSAGLARDIPGAEIVWIHNLGHKPDWTVPEVAVTAIEKVAGKPVDLNAVAASAARRIAGDDFGKTAGCVDEKPAGVPAPAR